MFSSLTHTHSALVSFQGEHEFPNVSKFYQVSQWIEDHEVSRSRCTRTRPALLLCAAPHANNLPVLLVVPSPQDRVAAMVREAGGEAIGATQGSWAGDSMALTMAFVQKLCL